MKKYIFLGGLIGFLLGLSLLTPLSGQIIGKIAYYLGFGFITGGLANITGIGIGILLVFLIPIIVYGFLGYIIGHFLKRK